MPGSCCNKVMTVCAERATSVCGVTNGMKEFQAHKSMLLFQSHQSLRQKAPGESPDEHLTVTFCPLQGDFSPTQSYSTATYLLDLEDCWHPTQRTEVQPGQGSS